MKRTAWNEGMAPVGHTPAMPAKLNGGKATRHAIKECRKEIDRYEQRIARNLVDLNEAKRVMYERGWSEES